MRRRQVIGACGTMVVSITDCISYVNENDTNISPTNSTATHTATRTPTNTKQSPAQPVSVLSLQPVLVARTSPDSIGISGTSAEQYLYLNMSDVGETTPPSEKILFRFDGTNHRPMTDVDRLWYAYTNEDTQYTAHRGTGWLLYKLPATGDASTTALTWPDGEWRPKESLRQRLATSIPPLSLSIPESIHGSETPTLTFTVTNEGDIAGHFIAALNRAGPSIASLPLKIVSRLIPAKTTTTFEVADTNDIGVSRADEQDGNSPDMTYTLGWTGGQLRRGVRIVDEA